MAKGMTPQQIAAKWSQNLSGATQTIQTGVQAVTTPPGQAAAAQKQAYVQGVNQNADIWAKNVSAVSTSEWQQAMINKGLPRVGTGATAAQPKMANVMQTLIPAIQSITAGLPPRGTLQQNLQRATTFATQLAAKKGQFKS
jgi:hypothetical protein